MKINKQNSRSPKVKSTKAVKSNLVKKERIATIVGSISSVLLTIISVILAIPVLNCFLIEKMPIPTGIIVGVLCVAGIASVAMHLYNDIKVQEMDADYRYYEESKRVSTALLRAIKRTDFAKTCSILQSTYGEVPKWHPINYDENVLVYDVHQHLRSICIRLKELIVSLAPNEFNDDMVTVDIAFSYPSDNDFIRKGCADNERNSEIPPKKAATSANNNITAKDDEKKANWKIITSGDHTSSDNALHKFLDVDGSFYKYMAEEKYAFGNDKATLATQNHYMWTKKDEENNNIGSIVGKVIELKNDNPEMVFVRVYLTISTYGRRLVEENDPLDEPSFEKLFKEAVINSYKTLIEAELAQMFIRHGVRNEFICRKNGKLHTKDKITKEAIASSKSKGEI